MRRKYCNILLKLYKIKELSIMSLKKCFLSIISLVFYVKKMIKTFFRKNNYFSGKDSKILIVFHSKKELLNCNII